MGLSKEQLEQLIARHLPSVWAVAIAIVGSPDDAEDVCQQSFIKCWDRREQCRDPRRFRSWLLTIARNTAHSHRRGAARSTIDPDRADLVATGRSPARSAEQSALRASLLRGLDMLSSAQRQVILLRDLEGWPHREIAEDLDISETMSRRHLSDARKKMRRFLQQAGEDDLRFAE